MVPMSSTALRSDVIPSPQHFPTRLWLITFAGWMFDFYDLILFSFLLRHGIQQDLHLTNYEEGVLLGVALGASGLGGILFGYLADRYGRKRVLMWTICVYSLGTGLTALSTGVATIFMFRLVTGIGVGGEWAVGHALLAESTPRHLRGRAAALLQAGEPVGVALAAVIGLLMAERIGWRWVLVVSSATASLAVLVRFQLPESALWDQQREEGFSPVRAARILTQQHLWGPLLKGWILAVFKIGTYWTCYIWLPHFLEVRFQQKLTDSLLWILTAQLGQLLGMVAFGVLADRFGRRQAFTAYSLLTAAALYPLAFHGRALVEQPVWFCIDFFVLGLGTGCTAGFGALLAELFPTQVRNFAMGTAYNCARGVQFLAPLVVGFFESRHGLAGGLGVPLVLALATASWVWVLPETRTRDLNQISKEGS